MLIKCRQLANVSGQNPFPLNTAKPVYASWTSGVNIVFSVYIVLLIIKGIGIIKPEFLMLHKRFCTVFSQYIYAFPALLTSQCWLQKDHLYKGKYSFDLLHPFNFCPLQWDFQPGCQVWVRFSFIIRNKANTVTSVSDHQTATTQELHWAFTILCRCTLVTQKLNGLFCYKATQHLLFAFQLWWMKSQAAFRAHLYWPGHCPQAAVVCETASW